MYPVHTRQALNGPASEMTTDGPRRTARPPARPIPYRDPVLHRLDQPHRLNGPTITVMVSARADSPVSASWDSLNSSPKVQHSMLLGLLLTMVEESAQRRCQQGGPGGLELGVPIPPWSSDPLQAVVIPHPGVSRPQLTGWNGSLIGVNVYWS